MPILSNTDITKRPLLPGTVITAEPAVIRTAFNTSSNKLEFGTGVARGTADDEVIVPSATGFIFFGVLSASPLEKRAENTSAAGILAYPAKSVVSVCRRGLIAVFVDSDCVQGQPAYLIHTASAGQVPGHFRKNNTGADLVPNALFWKTLTGPGIGVIALNLP